MSGNGYIPQPINLDDIDLPKGLEQLIIDIAENVHKVWASNRINEGWHYGHERNDNLKTHPCLIPYKELPDIEKTYDKETVINTIKLVLKLGYKITK